MRAAEIRTLAHQARVGPGVPVLDLCCGVAGPGQSGADAPVIDVAAGRPSGIVEPLGGYYVDPHDVPALQSACRTEPASTLQPG